MCDYEYPSIFNEKLVKARKDHKCCECGVLIKQGCTYSYIQGLWDGSFSCFKTCLHCFKIYGYFRRLRKCFSFTNLHEYVEFSDKLSEYYSEYLKKVRLER